MEKIKGGYYIKARCIQDSWIAKAPPHVREIWDFILNKANFIEDKSLKRGQVILTYSEIIEGLAWFVGYRKMTYKKHHCELATRVLTRERMVTTTKTTRGLLITVLNYKKYQNPKNYEYDSEVDNGFAMDLQGTDALKRKECKEGKKGKEKEEEKEIPPAPISPRKKPARKAEENTDLTKCDMDAVDRSKIDARISPEVIKQFILHRKVKKSPLTQFALELTCKTAIKCSDGFGITPDEAILYGIERGWLSINYKWMEKDFAKPAVTGELTNPKPKQFKAIVPYGAQRMNDITDAIRKFKEEGGEDDDDIIDVKQG